jgi:cysteine-rich repeat protein
MLRAGAKFTVVVAACMMAWPLRAAAFSFVPGHFYTTNYWSLSIIEYDRTGEIIDSVTLPAELGEELKGLAFGPDGLLYVTAGRGLLGFAVLALDGSGAVQATYPGNTYIRGNLSYGKIALDDESIYVTGQNDLVKFQRTPPGPGVSIYSNNQVFDVEVLPNGHLLVASAYEIEEITATGEPVRNLGPPWPQSYTDVRGIEYEPSSDKVFVTHLGHTGFNFRLMRVDAATGVLEADVSSHYADDLFVTSDGELLVGSRTLPVGIYSTDLELLGELAGNERMFVTECPFPNPCGNGVLDPGETCDDGNDSPGDGCDETCQREPLAIGISAKRLAVFDRPSARTAGKVRFMSRDPSVNKGAGVDTSTIEAELTIAYGNGTTAGGFLLPAGDSGWKVNDAKGATFVNRLAPAGATQTKIGAIRPGRGAKLVAKGVGDDPLDILGAGDPAGSVFTAYCIRNGDEAICLCSEFDSCAYKASGTRAKLVCTDGVEDSSCAAFGD